MKKLIVLLLFSLGINSIAQNKMDQFEIQVDGLGCPFCAYGLEKKFKEFKGIKKVTIKIETGDFSFQYPSEKPLSVREVEEQVKKAGYTPISTKIIRSNGKVEKSRDILVSEVEGNQSIHQSIFVAGNCEMCKARIEKAAKEIPGIVEAHWSKETKLLEIHFLENIISLKNIEEAIVKSGHDTKTVKAKKEAYEALPACCQFERVYEK